MASSSSSSANANDNEIKPMANSNKNGSVRGEGDKELVELFDKIYLETTPAVDDNTCKVISEKIISKSTKLVNVVEELGPRLTSTHVQERSKAVEILARVFTHLPSDFLNETELLFIVDFLCDRCKDQHLVMPKIIMCALPIAKSLHLPKGCGAKLLENLFKEANVQSHIHRTRNIFFRTLQALLETHLEELQNMSSDFIMYFLQSMDGEKDPRNLLLLFRIIPRIIANFNLEPFLEDFFEILSCYFPIDFNPSVSVPGEEVITRQDLSRALHLCLSQTNEFSDMLIPLVLEKLDSSLVDAKLDSLELLALCCERSYTPKDLEPFLGNLWLSLRREIFMGGHDRVERKCYEFLRKAFKIISNDGNILDMCLTLIYTECKHHLSQPDLRLIMPTSNILQCINESGMVCCTSIVRNMYPALYEQILKKPLRSEKKRLMGIWGKLLKTCKDYGDEIDLELLDKWDEIRALWFNLVSGDDMEMVNIILSIFADIIPLQSGLSKGDVKLIQEHMIRIIGEAPLSKDTESAMITLSRTLCHYHGEEFASVICTKLLSTLSHSKDSFCAKNCSLDTPCEIRSLSSRIIGESCYFHIRPFEESMSFLLSHVEGQSTHLDSLRCLREIIQGSCGGDCSFVSSKKSLPIHNLKPLHLKLSVMERVLNVAFSLCKELKGGDSIDVDADVLMWNSFRELTTMTRCIIRSGDEKEQENALRIYWNGKVSCATDIEEQFRGIPGLLVEAILGPVRPQVNLKFRKELVLYILQKVIRAEDQAFPQEFHVLPYVRLLASLLNKVEGTSLEPYLEELEPLLDTGKVKEDQVNSIKILNLNLIHALIWIVKALAMRGFPKLELWIDKLMQLLNNEIIGGEVVKCFYFLVADDPFILNQESHCYFKFLYKQRVFLMVADKLVLGYRNCAAASSPVQFNFIRALSSQLKHIPSEVLFMKIDSVLPLLVASLKCNTSSKVLHSSLQALSEMMESSDTKSKITEYNHDLVPQLTELAKYKENMEVRIMALKCLRKCARSPTHLILPLRDNVVHNLVDCLDDPKRLVRKEASLTRNIWLLMGAPGGI